MKLVLPLMWLAALPLAADVCQGLPKPQIPPPDDAGLGGKYAYRLMVSPQGPAFRVTLHTGGDIEIADCRNGRAVQTLHVVERADAPRNRSFDAADINFDGWLDIGVVRDGGGTWASGQWFIYDPATHRFIENGLTANVAKLRSNWIKPDKARHEIIAPMLPPQGCGPMTDRYRVAGNRLVLVHKEEIDPKSGSVCRIMVSDLVDGKWRVTRVR